MPETTRLYHIFENCYDRDGQAIGTINETHKKVHDGMLFFNSGSEVIDGAGTVVNYMVKTPNDLTVEQHLRLTFHGDSTFTISIYKDAEVSSNGDTVAVFNANFRSTNTSLTKLYKTPTITDAGILVWEKTIYATNQTTTITPKINYEFVLPNNNFIIKMTKIEAGSGKLDYDIFWYDVNE